MIIRKATLEDFPQIDAFDVFALDRKAEINRGEILVAIIDDKIAGYITHNKNFYGGAFVARATSSTPSRARATAAQRS